MRKLVVAVCLILSGCATSNLPMQQGQGANFSTVQAKLGAPNVTNTLPNGNKVYIYTTQTYQSYPSATTDVRTFRTAGGLPIVVGTPPRAMSNLQMNCITAYEVNKQNIVVGVKRSGC